MEKERAKLFWMNEKKDSHSSDTKPKKKGQLMEVDDLDAPTLHCSWVLSIHIASMLNLISWELDN